MSPNRWDPHFMVRGAEFQPFWSQLLNAKGRKLLFICGAGFDPRALTALEAIGITGAEIAHCRLVEFSSGSGLVADEDLERADVHRNKVGEVFKDALTTVQVAMRSNDGRSTGGVRISEAFRDPAIYPPFSERRKLVSCILLMHLYKNNTETNRYRCRK